MSLSSDTKSTISSIFKFVKQGNSTPGGLNIRSIWQGYSNDALSLVNWYDFNDKDLELSKSACAKQHGKMDIKTVAWFIPEFDNPYWGGIHTILSFASYMKERKDVANNFIILGNVSREKISALMTKAFPALKDEKIYILKSVEELNDLPEVDVSICTLWTTAYHQLKFNKTKRKFYFIQDCEPLFYPAGSTSAQVEETYRFGFYGIANTISLKQIYEGQYGGKAGYFTPAVDTTIFHPPEVRRKGPPYTVYLYGRPGHPRNGFELGITTLKKLKNKMGDNIRIVTAGSDWNPNDLGMNGVIENLGLMQFEKTAELYRNCDVALSMMFTRHPSYIPFELMASGCLVVANNNPANTWLLRDGINCIISHASASCLCDTIEHALENSEMREKLTGNALKDICDNYSNWDKEFEKIYEYVCNPG